MARIGRAEAQGDNRARVLAAAREEFGAYGFREARVDRIAERAGLTRGAVYSNFPGKRALYFEVLALDAERDAVPEYAPTARTAADALGDFARAWLARLPLAYVRDGADRLGRDLLPEIAADEVAARPFAQLTGLTAIVLGRCLERLPPVPAGRMVRVAETALTLLHGASGLANAAPGFGEAFAAVHACRALADLDVGDKWDPVHLPAVAAARPVDEAWTPPADAVDALRGEPASLDGDGVVAVLGLHRLTAVEEALRAVRPQEWVTLVVVTGEPGEYGPLARLAVTELRRCLSAAVPVSVWPRIRIVHDESGALAIETGATAVSDATETAVRVRGGRITARADGYGACHAVAVE